MSLNDIKLETDEDVAIYYKLLGYKYYPTKLKPQKQYSLDEEIKIQEILYKLENGLTNNISDFNIVNISDLETTIDNISVVEDNIDKLNKLRLLLIMLDKDLEDYLVSF